MNTFANIFTFLMLLLCSSGYGSALTTPPQQQTTTTTGRRNFLQQSFSAAAAFAASAVMTITNNPLVASAEYGRDAKMSFPDVMQGLSDRATKQCLVESLGNRECLVYMDDAEKFLYKGADVNTLVSRLQSSISAVDKIPPLVKSKQWNAINSILTGPMGQLSSTLTMITNLASNPTTARQKAQIVKQDLFGMGTATTNKQGEVVLRYQQKALDDLADFLQSL